MASVKTALALSLLLQKESGLAEVAAKAPGALKALWGALKGTGAWGKLEKARPWVEWGLPIGAGVGTTGVEMAKGEPFPTAAISGAGVGTSLSLPYLRYMLTKSPATKIDPLFGPALALGSGAAAIAAPKIRQVGGEVLTNIRDTAKATKGFSEQAESLGKQTGSDIISTANSLAEAGKELPAVVAGLKDLTQKGIPIRTGLFDQLNEILTKARQGNLSDAAVQALPYAAVLGLGGLGVYGLTRALQARKSRPRAVPPAAPALEPERLKVACTLAKQAAAYTGNVKGPVANPAYNMANYGGVTGTGASMQMRGDRMVIKGPQKQYATPGRTASTPPPVKPNTAGTGAGGVFDQTLAKAQRYNAAPMASAATPAPAAIPTATAGNATPPAAPAASTVSPTGGAPLAKTPTNPAQNRLNAVRGVAALPGWQQKIAPNAQQMRMSARKQANPAPVAGVVKS